MHTTHHYTNTYNSFYRTNISKTFSPDHSPNQILTAFLIPTSKTFSKSNLINNKWRKKGFIQILFSAIFPKGNLFKITAKSKLILIPNIQDAIQALPVEESSFTMSIMECQKPSRSTSLLYRWGNEAGHPCTFAGIRIHTILDSHPSAFHTF